MTLQKGSKIGCVTSGVSFLGSGEGWKDGRMEVLVDFGNYGARIRTVLKSKCFFFPISSP